MMKDKKLYATQHCDYVTSLPDWKKTRAAVNMTVKAAGKLYLPYPSTIPEDDPAIVKARYDAYIKRAQFTGFTKRTRDGLVGSAFRVIPSIQVPDLLEPVVLNSTGYGLSVDQLAKSCTDSTMITGRSGLYTSFPVGVEGASQEQTANLKPTINLYDAEDIINWNHSNTLIVLRELVDDGDCEFSQTMKWQYRILRLRPEGATYQIDDGEELPLIDGFGQQFQEIPFEWVGTVNNDNDIDESMLLAIAELNIAHYMNSADLEENAHIHGQLTLGVVSELPHQDFAKANPKGINVGSRAGHYLGRGGNFVSVQAQPNSLLEGMMDKKKADMVSIGAKLIEKGNNETAEAVRIQAASETANLSSLVRNVSQAIKNSLKHCAQYLGIDGGDIDYSISQEFFAQGFDPTHTMAMIQLYDRGAIAMLELREPLRKSSVITRSDEDIDNDIATGSVL